MALMARRPAHEDGQSCAAALCSPALSTLSPGLLVCLALCPSRPPQCVCPEGQEDDGAGGCVAGSSCIEDGSGNCRRQTTRWQELAGGGCDSLCARCQDGRCRQCLEPNLHVVDHRSGRCRRKTCADRFPGCKACTGNSCERCLRGWKPYRGGCRRLPRCLTRVRHCVRCSRSDADKCGACRRGYRLRKSGQCVRARQQQ